jgi:phospholipase C
MTNRRKFLRLAARSAASAASLALLPSCIQRALTIPAAQKAGTIRDVEHVVVFTQENRSFDSYFGTLRGVRGFGDRFPIPLPGGRPVWHQRNAQGREVLPYHFDTVTTNAMRVTGTPHKWPDAQEAWNNGRMDRWLPAKTERSLGFYREADIPFQFALANAFTLCDAYHCSMQGGTNPNRLFLWTGCNDARGDHGGPALVNSFDDLGPASEGFSWTTYPERLEQAGVSWKQYQDMDDNYTDNPLEGFRQYRAAEPGSALHRRALSTHTLEELAQDVRNGTLPQVSWIIAPEKYSEHPKPSSPAWGAEYTAWVLDALTANPEVWSKTVLLLNFDENDGFFDHVPPPSPPARDALGRLLGGSTVSLEGEYHLARRGPAHDSEDDPPAYHGRAFGLGPRVPMYVISPWSRGGWVNSQVFDHTSVIRFLERRFGVMEPNISAWRRAVCGDLTTAFDFALTGNASLPVLPKFIDVDAQMALQSKLPPPLPPASPVLPRQQSGLRPSRALPYDLHVAEFDDTAKDRLLLAFQNSGRGAAVFHVYDQLASEAVPRRYTVEPGKSLRDSWQFAVSDSTAYDLCIYAPNGFFRACRGGRRARNVLLSTRCESPGELWLDLRNDMADAVELMMKDNYHRQPLQRVSLPRGSTSRKLVIAGNGYWYDFSFTCADDPRYSRRIAGRIETGEHGYSDAGLG